MAAILHKIKLYTELVKFEHTIFALPFALTAMLLASGSQWPAWQTVLWIIGAMVGGRTYAMGLNRLLDQHIDALNPRTQSRPLPAGSLKRIEAWLLSFLALWLMVFSTMQLPPLCLQLLPVAVVILSVYSLMKRFSHFSHLVLGVALGSSAIGGWLAVTGTFSLPPILFGLAVTFWVAGFDIIYACQDVEFDQSQGLHSLPVSFGLERALYLSRVFHGLTIMCLVGFGLMVSGLAWGFWSAVALTALALYYEQSLVSAADLSKVNAAFFQVNGIISVSVFLLILLDKLV